MTETPLYRACKYGYVNVVRHLLEDSSVDPNAREQIVCDPGGYLGLAAPTHGGPTALYAAAAAGHVTVVKLLLACDSIKPNETVLRSFDHFPTALWEAVHQNHEDVVRALLSHPDIEPNKGALGDNNSEASIPLCEAVHRNHVGVVQALLAHPRIDVNKAEDVVDSGSPLFIAFKNHSVDMVETLLRHPSIQTPRELIEPALRAAIRNHHVSMVSMVLTLLRHAIEPPHEALCWYPVESPPLQLLVPPYRLGEYAVHNWSTLRATLKPPQQQVSICLETLTGGKTRFKVDLSDTVYEVKERIFEMGGVPPDQQRLIYDGKQEIMDDRTLADYNVEDGVTLYLVLRLRGSGRRVGTREYPRFPFTGNFARILVKTPAGTTHSLDVDVKDTIWGIKQKICALEDFTLAERPSDFHLHLERQVEPGPIPIEIVRALLAHPRINPNTTDRDGLTPLRLAARNGRVDVIEELLKHPDTDPNIVVDDGNPLYSWALAAPHASVLEAIEAHPLFALHEPTYNKPAKHRRRR